MTRINALQQSLHSFQPQNDEQNRDQQAMLALSQSAAPFSRSQFEPGHFTASAFVLNPEETSILLIFHEKLQMWLQPGGHIEPEDHSLESAARRELLEETGVQVTAPHQLSPGILAIDIHDIPARKNDPEHKHFDVRYLYLAQDRKFQAASDALDARWVEFSEIGKLKTDTSVLNTLNKIQTLQAR